MMKWDLLCVGSGSGSGSGSVVGTEMKQQNTSAFQIGESKAGTVVQSVIQARLIYPVYLSCIRHKITFSGRGYNDQSTCK